LDVCSSGAPEEKKEVSIKTEKNMCVLYKHMHIFEKIMPKKYFKFVKTINPQIQEGKYKTE
jgi:hypothetical protein